MKDKNAAGILALFLGWLGFHRFYLGQTGLGVVYLMFCWFPLVWLIAFVDAISLFAMDQQRFDQKYNQQMTTARHGDADFDRPRRYESRQERRDNRSEQREYRREQRSPQPARKQAPERSNSFKKSGLEKFKEYDYAGAIEDFEKSLELAPRDIATHFNLACAYSLVENAEKSFHHLDQAVAAGFSDFRKIKEHHALAYLRIQKEFDSFEENGFRISKAMPEKEEDLLSSQPNLLDQLKKLGELREKGLLTEQEFADQKRKLLK
jgi:TM2 domain-containing membrane protein YozV